MEDLRRSDSFEVGAWLRRLLPRVLRWIAVSLFVALLAFAALWLLPDRLVSSDSAHLSAAERLKARNDVRTPVIALLAALGAAAGVIYTARSYGLSRSGQTADRFTTAVGQLKDPELSVRLGALYAFEGIARDSSSSQDHIIEILSSWIRDRTTTPREHPETTALPLDIQTALNVLARRRYRFDEVRIDLTGAHLERAILRGANLRRAKLSYAHLEGADLYDAVLVDADAYRAVFTHARLDSADLRRASFGRADLRLATLSGANLRSVKAGDAVMAGAKMHRTSLFGAFLNGADLRLADLTSGSGGTEHPYPPGADLEHARLQGADLTGADLRGVDLDRAYLENTNLSLAKVFRKIEKPWSELSFDELEGLETLRLPEGSGLLPAGDHGSGADAPARAHESVASVLKDLRAVHAQWPYLGTPEGDADPPSVVADEETPKRVAEISPADEQ